MKTLVFIVTIPRRTFKFVVTNAHPIFVTLVIGVMNFKPITKYASAIDAMPFIVEAVTKWINAMIAVKLFVRRARRCFLANFAADVCVKIAPRRVDGTFYVSLFLLLLVSYIFALLAG